MDYCDKLMPTPAFIVYKDPVTGRMCVGGTDVGLEFAESQPSIVTRFQAFLGDLGKY